MEVQGRDKEIALMEQLLESDRSEFLALYGRRRVGKTYLIDQLYGNKMVFAMSGLHDATLPEQLQNFSQAFQSSTKQITPTPKNWLEAFHILIQHIEKIKRPSKKVVFIDELPWLSTARSGFLSSIEHFWNSWASKRKDILLVVCGSAASWMIQNIVRNKGGLHNRITQTIRLLPFTLGETEKLLKSNGIKLSQYQMAQIYMVTGGIPYYLMSVKRGQSVPQIINNLCFNKDALLAKEFDYLFESLFGNGQNHLAIINALAEKNIGLTRTEILKKSKLPNAGSTTRLLDELEESGFIGKYTPFEKKSKDALYRIADPYTLFYYKFIKSTKTTSNTYLSISQTASWPIWQGLAFENICLYHIPQIKDKLGISGVNTLQASWIKKGNKLVQGAQIDMLIDRDDAIINVCEAKFSQDAFVIEKEYAKKLQTKLSVFKQNIKSKKSVFLVFISTTGVQKNEYYFDLVQNEVKLTDLFADAK
ncbi:MAG: ATP-binding protein [Saprospiraceae bacterium]|nr:AAA family ATPase [Saprospiraceae bacterium]MBP7644282.1 AAA family ATPase [Saprospiraceae bacterium]